MLNQIFTVLMLLVFMENLTITLSFNIDTINYVIHRSEQKNVFFGYSVAQHKYLRNNWVLVGAPKANSKEKLEGVTESGAVYLCDVTNDDSCTEVVIDKEQQQRVRIPRRNGAMFAVESKSNQWLGATVKSSRGDILVCAPRFVNFYYENNFFERTKYPVGKCFVSSSNFSKVDSYISCGDSATTTSKIRPSSICPYLQHRSIQDTTLCFRKLGYCQSGFSADFSKISNDIFIGAVGSHYAAGQILQFRLHNQNILSFTLPESHANSYYGYSVASGRTASRGFIASSAPTANFHHGIVALYSNLQGNPYFIRGEKMGSYFGYAVITADVNGNGLDDLIIGAPLFSNLNSRENYEVGRVYVYLQTGIPSWKNWLFSEKWNMAIDGEHPGGRFGMALTPLGDINKDNCIDIAVAAPYGGKSGLGAVYIYHGSKEGIHTIPTQVIYAEDMPHPVSSFGFSLSGGTDLDNNNYPDLVIGAYESDAAFVFRTRPITKVQAYIRFDKKEIDISTTDFKAGTGSSIYLNLFVHLKYTGESVEDKLDFNVELKLDVDNPSEPRMFFDSELPISNQTVWVTKGEWLNLPVEVHIKPDIRDKFSQIAAEMKYSLKDHQPSRGTRSPKISAILDPRDDTVRRSSTSFKKNCGSSNTCTPDLQLTASSKYNYIFGLDEHIKINVTVENVGDEAYESILNVQLPPNMAYMKYEQINGDTNVNVRTTPSYSANTLQLDIGNPMPRFSLVNLEISFQPKLEENSFMNTSFSFTLDVESINPEESYTKENNRKTVIIYIVNEAELILNGSSVPEIVSYNASKYKYDAFKNETGVIETQIGPEVLHRYNIRNKGPADIHKAIAVFSWPSYTTNGDHLLYLLPDKLGTSENIQCVLAGTKPGTPDYLKDIDSENQTILSGSDGMSSRFTTFQSNVIYESVKCRVNNCSLIACEVGPLTKDQDASISIYSRVSVKTLDQFLQDSKVNVSSFGAAQIVSLRINSIDSIPHYEIYEKEVSTIIVVDKDIPQVVGLWRIVLAASAGVLIFLCLCFLLYKIGFFKRNRPGDQMANSNTKTSQVGPDSSNASSSVDPKDSAPAPE